MAGVKNLGGCACCAGGPTPCGGTFNCCVTVFDGCSVMPGCAVHATGPGGFTFDGVADSNGLVCFPFNVPGSYTITADPPATPAGRYVGVSQAVTLTCANAFTTLTLGIHPDYVLLCCCSAPTSPPFFSCAPPNEVRCLRYPIKRTLNWTWGTLSGTAVYRDASDPNFPRQWVGCVGATMNAWNPLAPGNGHGNDCDPDTDPSSNCVHLNVESEGKLWVFLRSCMAVSDSRWAPFLNMRSCPTVGRSCADADFVSGPFCNGAGGEQIGTWFATFNAAYTWSCNPFTITFSVTGGALTSGVVGAGASLVFTE